MPPKILKLGKKAEDVAKEVKFSIPKDINRIIGRDDILDEKKLQLNITHLQKNEISAKTRKEENKLPRLIIDSVVFNILNTKTLDDMAIVNVSSKLSRVDDISELIQKNTMLAAKNAVPGCYRFNDGYSYAGSYNLLGNQSVTSYTEMGTVENNKLCSTCFKTNEDCPGHIGEVKLHTKFVHPLFKEYLIKVLTCVCNSCSTLLIPEALIKRNNINKLSGKNKLNRIYDMIEKISGKNAYMCPKREINNCRTNPKYCLDKRNPIEKYEIEYSYSKNCKKDKIVKNINEIIKVLDNISVSDAKLMGFDNGSHPRDMVLESLPIIPPVARPYTVREGEIKEDHITTAYDEIIKDNHKYSIINDENYKHNIKKDLYFHISHLIDNSDKKYCRSPTEKIQGIKQRLSKKEGLIRGFIMGKRVNFCGRSVIGPDSTLKFGEVAIPETMAKVLTVPEVVHERNIEFLRDLWDKRQITHIRFGENGERRRVTDNTYEKTINGVMLRPEIGYIVERYVQNGDVFLVNRQPTLYKYGMVGNFIKIVPRKNIGIHMTETKMRNADFDGDEIGVYAIQTLDARVEAATFASSQACIPNALITSAMIGQQQNSVSSAYIMTRNTVDNIDEITQQYLEGKIPKIEYEMYKEVKLTPEEFEEGLSKLTYTNDLDSLYDRLAKHKIDPLSGKALFSALLPKDLYYKNDDGGVEIKNGVLIKGVINGKHIGDKGAAIHMSIWKWYGKNRAVAFITDCTFLTDWFIYNHGLTVGFNDVSLNLETKDKIDSIIRKNINGIKIKIASLGKVDENMTEIEKNFRERQVLGFLQEFKTEIDKIGADAVSPINPLNIMANSLAKGSAGNTSNIVAIKGQEMVFGERPVPKLCNGARCLPYFEYDSEDIRTRGFVSNSFIRGMTPSEMYFLSESGRVGQLGTATGTAESGALYRKLVKVLEDCKISYDGSVRNASNAIYQFTYLDGYEAGESTNVYSESTGKIISFINIKEAVDKINSEYM